MPTLHFETDPPGVCQAQFGGPTGVLVNFLSLAFATRYGSQHPLSQLALLLRGEYSIDLAPLTTFADRNVEEEADAVELSRVWQDAAPLAACARRVAGACRSDDSRITTLTQGFSDLPARLEDLARAAECAATHGARVRLSYDL